MTSSKPGAIQVVVVDGSNIATEGRSTPSLGQLNDAVTAFIDEFPDTTVTVVVDATFGHRIDKREAAEFEEAVANNELVAPPAGAIGRGDAFVLNIANKVGARILSNDSFQEFHGEYPWLFDEGRLIGGKPVPHVGWVFVERLPVKGPVSRKAQRAARVTKNATAVPTRTRRRASAEASQPMPVPTAPPPGPRRRTPSGEVLAVSPEAVAAEAVAAASPAAAPGPAVNDLLTFLEFVEHHPIGSSVNGVVESYSSHGAYVTVGNVRGYVPLRLMADRPPRSAREVMRIGDAVTLVVTSFAPGRRSVDLAVPEMAPMAPLEELPEVEVAGEAPPTKKAAAKKATTKKTPGAKKAATKKKASAEPVDVEPVEESAIDTTAPTKKVPAKKAAAKRSVAETVPEQTASATPADTEGAPVERRSRGRKRAAPASETTAAPAEVGPASSVAKTAAKKSSAKEAATRKTPAKKSAEAADRTPSKRTSKAAAPADQGSAPASAASGRGRRRRSSTQEREGAVD